MENKLDDLYKQGMEHYEKGEYGKAERVFQELLTINPRFADIQNKMGIIFNQTNRLDLAAKAFEKALEMNPGYTEASLNLAITYSDLGKYDKSREVFERASRFNEQKKGQTPGTAVIDPFVKGKLADEHLRIGNMYYDLRLLDEEMFAAIRRAWLDYQVLLIRRQQLSVRFYEGAA